MNKKAYTSTEDMIKFAIIAMAMIAIAWFILIKPQITSPPEKQSALSAVQELQDNYDNCNQNVTKCWTLAEVSKNAELEKELQSKSNSIWVFVIMICMVVIFEIITFIAFLHMRNEFGKAKEKIDDYRKIIEAIPDKKIVGKIK